MSHFSKIYNKINSEIRTYLFILIPLIHSAILGNLSYCQHNSSSDSAYFHVEMFSVAGSMAGAPQPGTQEFRDELRSIWQGTENGFTAINTLHVYGHYIDDTDFWMTYLEDLSTISDSLKTLADCQFVYVDTNNDTLISQDELNSFISLFETFLAAPNSDHIAGWYIADEPTSHEYEPAELEKIYLAIKQRDSRPIYIAEAPEVPGAADYSRFHCDILMIDNY